MKTCTYCGKEVPEEYLVKDPDKICEKYCSECATRLWSHSSEETYDLEVSLDDAHLQIADLNDLVDDLKVIT